ncbi:unnamed protein product [Sphagnum troendelagicum]|uniref:Glycosyltransferase 2-like domain-containing protein n=1 Tax=Sphagnum troendelagicum TaxID=128251 RepID=A0ABP0TQ59_9BRYO
MKDREEFLPWSSGNATTAATVKKKYHVSGFFKVSKQPQQVSNIGLPLPLQQRSPLEIPMETIRAVLAMEYPMDCFRILVLDDGGHDDLKASVEALRSESYGKQLRYVH